MHSLGLIGYGAMGKLICEVASSHISDSNIKIFDVNQNGLNSLEEVLACDIIIPAVPDTELEPILTAVQDQIKKDSLIVSISAIMTLANSIFEKLSIKNANIILSHPLFGPATFTTNKSSLTGQKIALHNFSCSEEIYLQAKDFLNSLELEVLEVNPLDHDQICAKNHFLPFLLSHVLKKSDILSSDFYTGSASHLKSFLDSTSYNPEMLKDILQFNPSADEELKALLNEINNFVEDLDR